MDPVREVWAHGGIDGWGVLSVVVATTVLYLVYTLVLQIAGQRLSANPSVLSFSVLALLGALVARAMLGETPTMLGGLVAIATLLVLEFVLGRMRGALARVLIPHGPRPTVVMVHGHVLRWQLRHVGMDLDHLHTLLRRAGLLHVHEADLVIMESRGTLTVVRRGERIDRALLADVRGAEIVPRSLIS